MMTIQQALSQAAKTLAALFEQPQLEADILLAAILKKPRSYLHAWPETKLTAEEARQFAEFLNRRAQLEPVAYLTGVREFWSLPLTVTPDTLIPRPETELLVETALQY